MPRLLTFLKAAVASERERERARVLARAAHVARTRAARDRGGIPGWFTWCVAAPLTLLCPPVFVWLLIVCLANPRT